MKELLIATTNSGKLLEYQAIIKDFNLEIKAVSLKEINKEQKIEETGQTFEENATQKARFYHSLSDLATLADDAGLEIDYLAGEPGVKTRRWPGYEASDQELIQMALHKLKGVPPDKRTAQLRAVIALVFPGDEKNYTFEGILRGHIAETPMTTKRFDGYPFRSIFIPQGENHYLGELSIIAHRRQAFERALPIIKKYLC